jgi:1-acyl-sn-glycerol-3-phosphate acyltransferase
VYSGGRRGSTLLCIVVARRNSAQEMKLYEIPPFILQRIIWFPTYFLLVIFCRLEVRGKEHVRNAGRNVIFASNHSCELDPVFVNALCPYFSRHVPLFYVSREQGFYSHMGWWKKRLYGSWFFTAWGAFPAHAKLRNYGKSLEKHLAILRDGNDLCIFPVWRDGPERKTVPAKGGVAYLARETGVPVIPVSIDGTEGMTAIDFILRRRKVVVTAGPALYAKDIFKQNAVTSDERARCEAAAAVIAEKIERLQ